MKNVSLENVNRVGKIKRRKHVMSIEEYNKYINLQLHTFSKHSRGFGWGTEALQWEGRAVPSSPSIHVATEVQRSLAFTRRFQHYFIPANHSISSTTKAIST